MSTQTQKPLKASGLDRDALGLAHSVIIGVAGTAPSYSIAATMAALIAAVGVLAPASLLYCGLIMFGITFAYMHLNRVDANAGASYAWVSRVFNHTLGFFAGWTVLVSSALFMVSATIPAAQATLLLFEPVLTPLIGAGAHANKFAVTAVAIGWMLAVSAVLVTGIRVTGVVQTVMTTIELLVLAGVALTAFWQYGGEALQRLSWASLSIAQFDLTSFASGAVISLFFFWGWDVALNLNEETRHGHTTPGHGAVVAMLIIMSAFIAFSAITLTVLTDEEIVASSTNVIFAVADKLFPRPCGYVAVLAVMLSTIGTLETSILQFTRTMFAKSRAGVLHRRWAQIHARWKTPHVATLLIATLGAVLLLLSLIYPDSDSVMKASIGAIGVQAAYYYGLVGFACAWEFRKGALSSPFRLVFMVLWPAASATVLWAAAMLNMRNFDAPTAVIAIGGILIGFVPLSIYQRELKLQ